MSSTSVCPSSCATSGDLESLSDRDMISTGEQDHTYFHPCPNDCYCKHYKKYFNNSFKKNIVKSNHFLV